MAGDRHLQVGCQFEQGTARRSRRDNLKNDRRDCDGIDDEYVTKAVASGANLWKSSKFRHRPHLDGLVSSIRGRDAFCSSAAAATAYVIQQSAIRWQ